MASFSSTSFGLMLLSLIVASAANFNEYLDITWGDGRGKILNNGDLLTLSLDKPFGSGFQSNNEYLFSKIDMQLKLIPLSSQGATHDEIGFEFLGNLSGDPYTLHTNVFTQARAEESNSSTCGSTPLLISTPIPSFGIFNALLDGTPIREFKNAESVEVAYPKKQAMRIYFSLWNANDWATRGGLVKTDWTKAPFTASYRNFNVEACIWASGASSCSSNSSSSNDAWQTEELDSTSQQRLKWVQKNYMIYNYCTDT